MENNENIENDEMNIMSADEVSPLPVEEVDTIFGENGVEIMNILTLEDPRRIVMYVKSDIHPDAGDIRVTMYFEDDTPSNLDFEGPDTFTEEEAKEVLNSVMNSLVTTLERFTTTNSAEDTEDGSEEEEGAN